jgi:hypothetical protein
MLELRGLVVASVLPFSVEAEIAAGATSAEIEVRR